jgi:hypothetical protein
MTTVLARRSEELRAEGEALIRRADGLLCESWNERMWADGERHHGHRTSLPSAAPILPDPKLLEILTTRRDASSDAPPSEACRLPTEIALLRSSTL